MALDNKITKEELFAELANIGVDKYLEKVKKITISSLVLQDLYKDNNDNIKVLLFLSKYPPTPARILNEIVENISDINILKNLAEHPRISQEPLINLAERNICEVDRVIAQSKQITPNTINILIARNDIITLVHLASNESVQSRQQIELSEKTEIPILNALLGRKNIHHTAFKNCLKNSNHLLATSYTVSKKINEDHLIEIADSANPVLQEILLNRDNLPNKVLESLYFNANKDIIHKAISKKELEDDELLYWSESDNLEIRKSIAEKENLPDFIEDILINDIDIEVQKTLAKNENISEYANVQLIQKDSSGSEIIPILAQKNNITSKIIKALCYSENLKVLKMLAYRKDLTEEHLNILVNENFSSEIIYHLRINEYEFKNISLNSTEKIINHKSPTIRSFAAQSANINAELADELSTDKSDTVREIFVKNIDNKKYLEKMKNDTNETIARFATGKLEEIKTKEFLEGEKLKKEKKDNKIINKIFNKFKK